MGGKAKPTKHTSAELAQKAKDALTNKGGGDAGKKDRAGGSVGHSKYKCNICKQAAPDPKSMQMHFESNCGTLKSPRAPALAWAATLFALQHFKDSVPAWLLPSMLIASGVHGIFFIDQAMDMYKIGVPLSKQSKTMAKFVNSGFLALGTFLLAPTLGWSSAQAFGAYALVYTALILKMVTVDGGAELFNVAGGYAWAAIFGGAGVTALMA